MPDAAELVSPKRLDRRFLTAQPSRHRLNQRLRLLENGLNTTRLRGSWIAAPQESHASTPKLLDTSNERECDNSAR